MRSNSPSLPARFFDFVGSCSKTNLRIAATACALALIASAHGQVGPKPTQEDAPPSKVDIYGGTSYFRPWSELSGVGGYEYKKVDNLNATLGISYFFGRHWGAEMEGQYLAGGAPRGTLGQCDPACSTGDPTYYSAELGAIYRVPLASGRFVPYAHLLFGGARFSGPVLQPLTWGQGATIGAGADYVLPFLWNILAVRGQFDEEGMHANFGPSGPLRESGGVGDVNAYKFSGGLVLRLGTVAPPIPVALSCSVQPDSVFPGDPLTVTGTATYLNPKKTAKYTFTSTGGTVTPSGATATVATAGLAPGSYTVNGSVSEGGKPWEMASCTSSFTVKAFEPPTLSCSANPSSINAGDTSMITASGMSPQNRALTYSYTASAGQISGTGPTATLTTAGVPPGTIQVTCNVTDDLGKSATASTSVVVQSVAPPPAAPSSQTLCSIAFDRDARRPTRVDNEGKACLDDLALSLQQNTGATLDLVGNAGSSETDGPKLAAERAVNTKDYLVKEKGIDATRIAVFTGTDDAKSVTTTLVPTGASPVTATPVDETVVKPQPRKPLGATHHKKHHHKKEEAS
jgi:outer membrane protein OmpA-like peptidoglycan-associated protein